MKKTLLLAAAIGALFAGQAAAQDLTVGYNLAATSNYVWRGASQTDNNGALQGGVDVKKGSFYVGGWASNVDFGTNDDTEVDLYFGTTPTVGNFSFDFGAIAYWYNGDTDSVTELKAGVSHPMGKGTIGAAMYVDADSLEDPYYEINASYPLTDNLSISGAVGNCEGGYCNGLGNYTTYNFGATYALTSNVSVDVRYSDISNSVKQSWAKPATYVTLKTTF